MKLNFAAFLKDDQGRGNTYRYIPSFAGSNSTVHGVIRQFRCRERAAQLEQTHLVPRSEYSFTIFCNWHYGLIEYQ